MIPENAQPIKHRVVAIVGPTASGKTSLGVFLAKQFCGEIISADARQIYRQMKIGTNRPTEQELQHIHHIGFDLVNPNERYNAFQFQALARQTISEMSARGRLPLLVGGTGLYIQAVLYDYVFGTKGRTFTPHPNIESCMIGIDIDRATLYSRINARVETMVAEGLEEEVKSLVAHYGWDAPALSGIGYRQWRPYFEGTITKTQLIQNIQQATRQYAKRQLTWFRGDKRVIWITNKNDAVSVVEKFLSDTR